MTDNVYGDTGLVEEPDRIGSVLAILGIICCVTILLCCLVLLVVATFCQRTADDWQNVMVIGWVLRSLVSVVGPRGAAEGGEREDRYL